MGLEQLGQLADRLQGTGQTEHVRGLLQQLLQALAAPPKPDAAAAGALLAAGVAATIARAWQAEREARHVRARAWAEAGEQARRQTVYDQERVRRRTLEARAQLERSEMDEEVYEAKDKGRERGCSRRRRGHEGGWRKRATEQ